MEEESGELHSEENKVSTEKTKKRKLKTPSQVEALENFYNEHKYPTESLKLDLAERIGLTEKQVSGWFCHRRLKDKRLLQEEACGNGKQDRSSGVIQDRGSGLRQDSCGSTKQGDYSFVEPKEVESRRLGGEALLPADQTYEQRRHYAGDSSSTGDSSSETSSPLQDRFIPQSGTLCDTEAPRYITPYATTAPKDAKSVKNRGHIRPSGYLKVKGNLENSAISAVKRQLGMDYREHGPPLGVEFQLLPPGAFGSPISDLDPVCESYNDGDSILRHSSNEPGIHKQPNLSARYEGLCSKRSSLDSYSGVGIRSVDGPEHWADYSGHQSKQKPCMSNYGKLCRGRSHSPDMNEDPSREAPAYSGSRNFLVRSNHGAEVKRLDSISNHNIHSYDGNIPNEQKVSWSHNYDSSISKNALREERCGSRKPSNAMFGHNKFLAEEKGQSRRLPKENKWYGERKTMKEWHDSAGAKSFSMSEKVSRRAREEYPQPDFGTEADFLDMPKHKNQIKESAVDMPSSFSEDETAETNSSMD